MLTHPVYVDGGLLNGLRLSQCNEKNWFSVLSRLKICQPPAGVVTRRSVTSVTVKAQADFEESPPCSSTKLTVYCTWFPTQFPSGH